MTFARVDDVAAELGRDIAADGTEAKQITKWLRRAEMLIRNRIPVLDEWCKDENYRDVVVEVESAAVARKALNPEGVSMFEPIGGSAPKYTGQDVINPLATICAGGMMLELTSQLTSRPMC